jgi:hypothetical protein
VRSHRPGNLIPETACWWKLGKYREAAEQFHAAREVDPTYTQAYTAEAQALTAASDGVGAAAVRRLKPAC